MYEASKKCGDALSLSEGQSGRWAQEGEHLILHAQAQDHPKDSVPPGGSFQKCFRIPVSSINVNKQAGVPLLLSFCGQDSLRGLSVFSLKMTKA